MAQGDKKSKITLDKLALMTQREFLVIDKKIDDIRENMTTKEGLKHFATKQDMTELRDKLEDDIRHGTVEVLRAVDEIAVKFDKAEKEEAAHAALYKRITDDLHHHGQQIKKLETRVL